MFVDTHMPKAVLYASLLFLTSCITYTQSGRFDDEWGCMEKRAGPDHENFGGNGWRFDFSSGATASSRSKITASAPSAGAFFIARSLLAGM